MKNKQKKRKENLLKTIDSVFIQKKFNKANIHLKKENNNKLKLSLNKITEKERINRIIMNNRR